MSDATRKKTKKEIYAPGASGVTGGTAIAAYANTLPIDCWYRAVLIIAAPMLTFVLTKLINEIPKWCSEWKENRTKKNAYKYAQKGLEKILENPNISDETKKKVQEELENLEISYARKLVSVVVNN